MTERRCPACDKVVTWKSGRYYPYCSSKCDKADMFRRCSVRQWAALPSDVKARGLEERGWYLSQDRPAGVPEERNFDSWRVYHMTADGEVIRLLQLISIKETAK